MTQPNLTPEREAAFASLAALTRRLTSKHRSTRAASLKPALKDALSGFNEGLLGYRTFREFLEDAERGGYVTLRAAASGPDVDVLPAGTAPELGLASLPFDEIRTLLVEHPARAIDKAIEEASFGRGREAPSSLLDLLAQGVYAVRGIDADAEDITFHDLGRRKLKHGDRSYAAGVLLRLLSANPHAIPENALGGYFREMVRSLPERLFKALDLPEDTFEHRLVELPSVVPAAEERLERAFNPLKTIEDIRTFQAEFLRALQDPFVAVAIRPFLSNAIVETSFPSLVAALGRIHDLSDADALSDVREAELQLETFEREAAALDNALADKYLGRVATILRADLSRRLDASPLSQSASLHLASPSKRLPLHREGEDLLLRLELVNDSAGPAADVRLQFEEGGAVEPLEPHLMVGAVGGSGRRLVVPAIVMQGSSGASLTYEVEWRNADGGEDRFIGEITLRAQSTSVAWEELAALNPYPSQAVQDDRLLAGRDHLLDELTALVSGPEVGSTRVSGEKRVGKSSLVRSLESRLKRLQDDKLAVAYLDINRLGLTDADTEHAVAGLLQGVIRQLWRSDSSIAELSIPSLENGGVDKFSEFLEDALERLGDRGILVILDEFDELPNGVFERGGAGDAFFRALKAFSSEGRCGFVLVGGEKLELALSRQHDRLNAFREHRVNYIGSDDLDDFAELVERPVRGFLEFDRESIETLHARTGGHPFYTLLVCRELLRRALELRDNHVTVSEIAEAYDRALESAPATAFAHIWFDYVFGTPDVLEGTADRRLRVLLAWSARLRARSRVPLDDIVEEAARYGVESIRAREELRELAARGIIRETEDGLVRATSAFVEDWLKEWGPERLRLDATASAAVARVESSMAALRVGADEVREVRDRWPLYQSRRVEAEDIRAWLDQFVGARNQRLAFQILKHLRFISNQELRAFFEAVHGVARKDTLIRIERGKHQREFAVVYAEGDGKSASLMAKQYAHANTIHSSCIQSASKLSTYLRDAPCERVVIVDDFVGTGGTAVRRLGEYATVIREAANITGRPVIFGVACAFQEGQRAIDEWVAKEDLPIITAVGEMLANTDHAFDEGAGIFDSADDRLVAQRLFDEVARGLGSTEPLGTGAQEALIVFEHNCPNNTLPLLWKKTAAWTPLFERVLAK